MLKLIFQICNKNWSKKCNRRWCFKFCSKKKLANLKNEVEKLDLDKLVLVPADLRKLSNVVKTDVVKRAVHDKSPAKVNDIDTSTFIFKTKY